MSNAQEFLDTINSIFPKLQPTIEEIEDCLPVHGSHDCLLGNLVGAITRHRRLKKLREMQPKRRREVASCAPDLTQCGHWNHVGMSQKARTTRDERSY